MANWITSFYAPGAGGSMEGPWATSRRNPLTNSFTPFTLDDVRLGRSPWVTVASDPSRYGQTLNLGDVTYRSPLDQKTYTLPNVQGYVHDTGSAFQGRPDKLDIAQGDFRGWNPTAASTFVAGGNRASPEGTSQIGEKTNMPGLMDMFSLYGVAGNPAPSWNDVIQQRQNSLIGMGLGLMGGGWAGGMRGYEQGAATDVAAARAAQQAREHAAELAFRRNEAARQASQWQQQFNLTSQLPEVRQAGALGLKPGTPEYQKFLESKIGPEGDWSVVNIDEEPHWVNKRTRQVYPIAPGATPPVTPGAAPVTTGAPSASPSAAPTLAFPPAPTTAPVAGTPSARVADAFSQFNAAPPTVDVSGTRADATAPPAAGQPTYGRGPKAFQRELELRKEFENNAKTYQQAHTSFSSMLTAQPNAAGDLSLVYGYIKLLDPTSAVREGEIANAQNTTGVGERILNLYNMLREGKTTLPADARQRILQEGEGLYNSHRSRFDTMANQYRGVAGHYRIDPTRVITDMPRLERRGAATTGGGGGGGYSQDDIDAELRRRGVIR